MSDKKRKVPKLRFPGFTDAWEQRKLGDVVEKCYGGGTPQTSVEEYWTGNIPWLQSSNLVDDDVQSVKIEKYISKEAIDKSAAKMIPSHSIAIVTRVGIGKLVLMDESYTTSQDFLSLSNVMLKKQFMLYALYLLLKNEKRKGQGTSIKGITKEALLGKSIRFPKTSIEQHQIGNFVKLFDSLISLHQRKLDNVKMLKKSLLQKLFPKDGEKIPELRFPGFTDAWEQRKLGEIFSEYSLKNRADLPPLTVVQGLGTILRSDGNRNLLYDKSNLSNYKLVHKDDFIVHLRSFEAGFEKANSDGIVSPAYHVFHGKDTDTRFYYPFFRSKRFIEQTLTPHVYGIRDGRSIDIESMKSSYIPATSLIEQIRIGKFIDSFDSLISLHQRQSNFIKISYLF